MDASTSPRPLLPPALYRPLLVAWTAVIPWLVLLLLNIRAFTLVSGEMEAHQRAGALHLGLFLAALILFAGLTVGAAWRRQWRFRLPAAALLLAACVGYLWTFHATFWAFIPSSVPAWMLNPALLLYYQYAFLMPAAFHATLLLACVPWRIGERMDVVLSGLVALGLPTACFMAARLGIDLFRWLPDGLLWVGLVAATIVLLLALLRLLTTAWRWMGRCGDQGRAVATALVAIAGPIGGLLLNINIPFPADFQSATIYGLAFVNGLALLFPAGCSAPWSRPAWLIQCALFPFTLYFFAVFLPFLPLSIVAIMALGTGFLMLVPTALFFVHGRSLIEGWTSASRRMKAAALLAMALLPALLVTQAARDRVGLGRAVDHVYAPDYARPAFRGSLAEVKRSLQSLRDFKAGLQLPFLGGLYSRIVFGGMVLPVDKMQHVHRVFFGEDLDMSPPTRLAGPLFGAPRRRMLDGLWQANPPPTNTVLMDELTQTRTVEEDCEVLRVGLTLTNGSASVSEYVAQMRVPPGVFVSGFWLRINGEMVAGRITEKKAALWVYESTRDLTRRDPGLLLYRGPDAVELRIYPFAAWETRYCEVEFIWPSGLAPDIRVADRLLGAEPAAGAPPPVIAGHPDAPFLVASPSAVASWRETAQPAQPYLHFIIDASSKGLDTAACLSLCQAAAERLGGASQEVMVSFANYELEHASERPVSIRELPGLVQGTGLPLRGGFCRDRALKGCLAWARAQAPDRLPLLIVVRNPATGIVPDTDLPFLGLLFPASATFYETTAAGALQRYDFTGNVLNPGPLPEAILAPIAGHSALVPAATAESLLVPLPPSTPTVRNARYRAGAEAWSLYLEALSNPSREQALRPRLVEQSRAAHTLTPLTASIVLENSAQWRLLERKEEQTVKGKSGLELARVPDHGPALGVTAAVILLLIAAKHFMARPRQSRA